MMCPIEGIKNLPRRWLQHSCRTARTRHDRNGAQVPIDRHPGPRGVRRPATAHAAADPVNLPLTGRPASESSGLRDGESYYAEDSADGVQWAADLPGATWVPTAIGFGPIPAGEERCPVPENVRALWGWPYCDTVERFA
jgi:hypothetical protein